MGPSRVTPPPSGARPSAIREPAPVATTPKFGGARAPITPPKAAPPRAPSPKPPPGEGDGKKGKEDSKDAKAKKAMEAKGLKATEKSPPPQGLSSYSSESVSGGNSPLTSASGRKSEASKKSKSRSPLARRPYGNKQRKKHAKGQFGKVKFADPIDDREGNRQGRAGEPSQEKGGGKDKGKDKGKSKGKNKGKPKGKGKGKSKASKSKGKAKQSEKGKRPGGASPERTGGRS